MWLCSEGEIGMWVVLKMFDNGLPDFVPFSDVDKWLCCDCKNITLIIIIIII